MGYVYAVEHEEGHISHDGPVLVHRFATPTQRDHWIADAPDTAQPGGRSAYPADSHYVKLAKALHGRPGVGDWPIRIEFRLPPGTRVVR